MKRRVMVSAPEQRALATPLSVTVDDSLGIRLNTVPYALRNYFENVVKGVETTPSNYRFCDSWDDVNYFLETMDLLELELEKVSHALQTAEEDNRKKGGIQTGQRPNFHVNVGPLGGNDYAFPDDLIAFFKAKVESALKHWKIRAAPVKRKSNLSCPTWVSGLHPLNDANAIMNGVLAGKLRHNPSFFNAMEDVIASHNPGMRFCYTAFSRSKLSHKFKEDFEIAATGPVALTESKGLYDELRLITAAPGPHNMALKALQDFGNYFLELDPVCCSFQQQDLFKKVAYLASGGGELRSSDFSSYDTSISPQMRSAALAALKPAIDALGVQHVLDQIENLQLLTPKYVQGDGGFLLNIIGCIRSGEALTALLGSLIGRMVNVHALRLVSGRPLADCYDGLGGRVFTKIKGDDKANVFFDFPSSEYYEAVRSMGLKIDGLPGFNFLMTHYDPTAIGPYGFVSRKEIQTDGREHAPPDDITELWGLYIRSCRCRTNPLFTWSWERRINHPSWKDFGLSRMTFDAFEKMVLGSHFQSKLRLATANAAGQRWLRDLLESGSQGSMLATNVASSLAIKAMFGLIDQNFTDLNADDLFDAHSLFSDAEALSWISLCETEISNQAYKEPGSRTEAFIKTLHAKGLLDLAHRDDKWYASIPSSKLLIKKR